MRTDVSLMLDSGAYSAWMKQETIPIEDYAKFVCEQGDNFDLIVNLDVIPGKCGQKDVPKKELDEAVEKGWDNYEYLIKKGIPKDKLIHVFHQGEDFSILKRMVEEMGYIGISPANDRTTAEKKVWLDEVMEHVLDEDGKPLIKFHGFGIMSLLLVYRYPWYSVDSSTWVVNGRLGRMLYPRTKFGRFYYKESPIIIAVSDRSIETQEKEHFSLLSDIEQAKILRYIKERKISMKSLRKRCITRDRLNMRFFLDMEKTLNGTRIYFAGNFPMLSNMPKEFKTMDMALKVTNKYRRLGSYYHKKYLLKLLDLKERKINGKQKRIPKRTNKS